MGNNSHDHKWIFNGYGYTEWINKLWHAYILEYSLAVKKKQAIDRHNDVDASQKHYDN